MRNRRGLTTKIRREKPYGSKVDWWKTRDSVIKRDGACRKCGSMSKLQVHHIISVSRGGRNTLANLLTLCESCHSKQPGHSHLR